MPDTNSLWVLLVITGFALIFYEFLLKKHVAPKGNRIFFYFLLLLHGLVFFKYSLPQEILFKGESIAFDLTNYTPVVFTTDNIGFQFSDVIVLIYLLGVGIGWIKFILGIRRLLQLNSKSSPGRSRFERRVKSNNFRPFTFFKYLFIPTNLPKDVYESVYYHEKYHSEQWHSMDMLLWHVLSILFWFNPFVHILKSKQAENLEYETDEQLIKVIPKDEYSKHLLTTVFVSPGYDFSPMFNRSKVYLRIKRLNQKKPRKGVKSSLTLLCTIILLFASLIMTKASFSSNSRDYPMRKISKPHFPPKGHGHYIDSVLQMNIAEKYDDIGKDFNMHLYLDITIDEKGKVIEVIENSQKSSRSGDQAINNYLSNALVEIIEDMPEWIPAKEGGVHVASTFREGFHFTGESE